MGRRCKKHLLPWNQAKFQQNTDLMSTLLNKTGYKKIVECTNDRLWGTGVPLNKVDCLDQSKWIGQGILGEILEEICFESRPAMNTLPPLGFDGIHPYFNNATPFKGITQPVTQQMHFSPAIWNTPCQVFTSQTCPTHVGYVPNMTTLPQHHSTMVALTSTPNLPETADNAIQPVDSKNPGNTAIPSNEEHTNTNSVCVYATHTEPVPQNEVEMTEPIPT